MDRLVQRNVLAMSGRAVEASGDVDVLLLDKTGTITLGNRQAAEFLPVDGVEERELAEVAQLASLADETPEGRSIVVLAKERFGIRERELGEHALRPLLGLDPHERRRPRRLAPAQGRRRRDQALRRGERRPTRRPARRSSCSGVARQGGTPLVVARDNLVLGVVHLKDIVKGGMSERFVELRKHGHPHRDDHGRQPRHRGRDRRRGRRRRLPRRGDARGEARADPRGAGARPHGRDDRRRHERCARARAGRRRRRHEHGHDAPPRRPATWSTSTRTRRS